VDSVPAAVARNTIHLSPQHRKRNTADNGLFFRPALFVDEIGLTSDKFIPLNATSDALPLRISIAPMSPQKWFLMSTTEDALKSQKSLGFTDKDIDDIRK
jgi:hypothetical protein